MTSPDHITHSPARERRILSFLNLDGAQAAILCAERGLTAEHFRGDKEAELYALAMEIHGTGVLCADIFQEEAILKRQIVTAAEFADCTTQNPAEGMASMEIPRLAGELKRLHAEFCILKGAAQIPLAMKDGDKEALQKAISAISEAPGAVLPRATWQQTGLVEMARYRAIAAGKEDPDIRSLHWPWRTWDIDFKPMRRGELVIVAGYTSLGKSSLMRQVCLGVAKAGGNTALASLEMPAGDIFGLMAGSFCRQACGKFKTAHAQDQSDLLVAMETVRNLQLDVMDNDPTLAGLTGWAKARHNRNFLDLLVIDYLGIISDCQESRFKTKASAVGQVAGAFKRLATELGCVVILGVQINRNSQTESNRMPRLSDLKDSGDIEAHADRVILLHRPDEDASGAPQSIHDSVMERPRYFMQLFQEKGRNVGTGSTAMWFNRELANFEQGT